MLKLKSKMPEWLISQMKVIEREYNSLPPRLKSYFEAEKRLYETEKKESESR